MRGDRALLPEQLAAGERRCGVRIRNARDSRVIRKGGKALELLAPPIGNRLRQLGAEIAEIHERRRRRKFLSHEQHRNLRREQQAGIGGRDQPRIGKGENPIAKGAVADHVVVL